MLLSRRLLLAAAIFLGPYALACTSVIVSSQLTRDGKAVMFKHRDSRCQEVAVEYFEGDTMWAALGKPDRVPCLPYRL